MPYEEIKSSGITQNTPKNILFGAGTIHKNLKFSEGSWNFAESLIGATTGGSKLSIKPEITDIEVDGAVVKVKGLSPKVGETATMELNFLEVTPEILKLSVLGKESIAEGISGYSEITSKVKIEEGDYVNKLGFIGKTLEGSPIIVIFDNALCTSGLELESKNKNNAAIKATFECYADLTGNLETLPYHIYYPTPAAG